MSVERDLHCHTLWSKHTLIRETYIVLSSLYFGRFSQLIKTWCVCSIGDKLPIEPIREMQQYALGPGETGFFHRKQTNELHSSQYKSHWGKTTTKMSFLHFQNIKHAFTLQVLCEVLWVFAAEIVVSDNAVKMHWQFELEIDPMKISIKSLRKLKQTDTLRQCNFARQTCLYNSYNFYSRLWLGMEWWPHHVSLRIVL